MKRVTSSPPAVIDLLVDGSPDQRRAWLEQAAASLSPETLMRLEAQANHYIDKRYPNDPASLFNLRHLWGEQVKKREVRSLFDHAHDRLLAKQVEYLDALQNLVLAEYQTMMQDALYASRRGSSRQRQRDQREQLIQDSLAEDTDLQRKLAVERAARKREEALLRLQAQVDRKAATLTTKLERTRRRLEMPHELHLKLYDVLAEMLKFQKSLNDRALRNPALADRLRQTALGLTMVMTTVQELIAELNAAGDTPPDPELVRQQSDALLHKAIAQLDQWQEDTREEAAS